MPRQVVGIDIDARPKAGNRSGRCRSGRGGAAGCTDGGGCWYIRPDTAGGHCRSGDGRLDDEEPLQPQTPTPTPSFLTHPQPPWHTHTNITRSAHAD
jgi:hypothetical protein